MITETSTHEAVALHAKEMMHQGYNCAEATFIAVAEYKLGEVSPAIRQVATGFGGGVGGSHEELCGALSGGVMAIGAIYGRSDPSGDRQRAYGIAETFRTAFLQKFDDTICHKLRAGYTADSSCADLVKEAVEVLLDVLDEVEKS